MEIYGSDLHIESPWSNKEAQHRFLDLVEQEKPDLLHITGKRKLCAYYSWLQVGKNQAFIDKHSVGMGNCTLGVHEALSYHPGYAGSNLEAIAALEFSRRQSASGYWGDTPRSMIFQVLARLSHPLAAFLVLRSIPGLIRDQHPDGLWSDYGPLMGPINIKTRICEETADEVVTLRILMTLKHFGFLDALVHNR